MELFTGIYDYFYSRFGDAMWYIFGFFVLVGVVAQWRLFEKAGQPGWTCLVPILGQINYLKIVGRPASHLLLFLIPGYNVYLVMKVWIETAQSFGKRTIVDYVLVVLLNGLYILNLGMSYDTHYVGPVYGKGVGTHPNAPRPSLA